MQTHEYRSPPEVGGTNALATLNPPPVPNPVPVSAGPGPGPGPQSKLIRLVLPVAVLAVGVLGMIDLAGADVAASGYIALPLAIVGLGLVARAWYGRGWTLAIVGSVLAMVLIVVTAAEGIDVTRKSATWRPVSIDQVDGSYTTNLGDAMLDMSAVDFTGQSKVVTVSLGTGNLTVIVPPKVDVRAEVKVNIGNAVVFGQQWGGIGQSGHTVTDQGTDGPGGGELTIQATVDVGNAEVRR